MIKRALVALLACLAVAAVAAGCGGGDDTTSGGGETSADSGSAPTKAAFVKEADAICTTSEKESEAEFEEFSKEHELGEGAPSKAQELEIAEQIVIPTIAKQQEEIAALTPPSGDEEEVEEIVDTLGEEIEAAEEDPRSALESGTFADASRMARDYGMKVCGEEVE